MGEPHDTFANTFVLVVYCMIDPVDEERRTIGDVGLLHSFLKIVPDSNVVHLSDSHNRKITTTDARQQLERLLQMIQGREDPCQIVVYYGGHGKPKGFVMDDGLCRHQDTVTLMETYLREGDSCWFLVDCCFSGNFCTFLQQRVAETGQDLKASYCCIMSTTHDEEAGGDEWCLPGAFVAAMEGRIPPQYSDGHDNGETWVPTLAQAVSYMADQHSIRKMDRMTAYISGNAIGPDDPFPFLIADMDRGSAFARGRALASTFLRGSRNEPISPELQPQNLNVGDVVSAKWRGGKSTEVSTYLLPTWYRATVTAIDESNGSGRFKFYHPTPPLTWECEVEKKDVIDELNFNYRYYNDTPSGIQRAQQRMAKCGKYIDYSIPVGTRVWGLWENDNVLYEAVIMSDRDPPWKKIDSRHFEKQYPSNVGAFVIVEWCEDEEWTIVPLAHLHIKEDPSEPIPSIKKMRDRARIAADQELMLSHTPMECLMRSFRSAGKILRPAQEEAGSSRLTCFWAEDSEWYAARPGELGPDDVGVLASHLCYKEAGEYCIVEWDEDGTKSCLPRKFVRGR